MHIHIDRQPPPIEEIARRLAARMAHDGIRVEQSPSPTAVPPVTKDLARRQRSLTRCHDQAEPKPWRAQPRDSGAYVPEMAARIEDDPNLTDGARRCARKLAEYVYRRNRQNRTAEITVTYLMRAMQRDRRTVQRYLRQLERAGYIGVEVIHATTRMCAGLLIELLAPLFAKHHRSGWPQKLMNTDAARMSQNYRFKIKYSRQTWAERCMDGVLRSLLKTLPPLPVFVAL